MGRVLNSGVDVFTLKEASQLESIVARAISQKFQNARDADALAANAGTAPTFALFDGDSFESICAHTEALTILKHTL